MLEEDEDEEDTEDYWFFVDQWFSRSEGDKAIVRELTPTDKNGKPLKGALEGKNSFLYKFRCMYRS